MRNVMKYIAAGSIAFTVSCVFYLLFSYLTIFPPFDEKMILNMLFISTSILAFMFFLHLLPIQSPLTLRISELLIVVIVLLSAGAFFEIFPFNRFYISSVIITGVLTYTVVIIVTFMSERATANKINTLIRLRKTEGV